MAREGRGKRICAKRMGLFLGKVHEILMEEPMILFTRTRPV
jgi:hypothetical protein